MFDGVFRQRSFLREIVGVLISGATRYVESLLPGPLSSSSFGTFVLNFEEENKCRKTPTISRRKERSFSCWLQEKEITDLGPTVDAKIIPKLFLRFPGLFWMNHGSFGKFHRIQRFSFFFVFLDILRFREKLTSSPDISVCCKDLQWPSSMDQGTYRFEH